MSHRADTINELSDMLFSRHGQARQGGDAAYLSEIYGNDPDNPYSWRVKTSAVDETKAQVVEDVPIKEWIFNERSSFPELPGSFPITCVDQVAKRLVAMAVAEQAPAVTEEAA